MALTTKFMAWSTLSGAESVAGSRIIFSKAKKAITWLAWCFGVCLIVTNIGFADLNLQLDWDSVTWPSGSLTQSYTVGPGDISVTFTGADTAHLVNSTPLITSDLTGGLNPVQDALEIDVLYPGSGSSQQFEILIGFTHPGGVDNISFSIFDLDRGGWVDVIQATATDGSTTFNPTSIVDSAANNSNGINTVTGTAGADSDEAAGTAAFTFAQQGITQVRIIYSNQETDFQWISLHDINFTYPADVDLSINKSHIGSFAVGQVGTYTLRVSNDPGATTELGPITVTDVLPAGLSYVSDSGTGWTCGVAGQDVTCTHPGPLAPGAALPDISLSVSPGASAEGTVVNTASVAGTSQDSDLTNNSVSDSTIVDPAPTFTPRNKPLYLYSTPANNLSRTPPVAAQPDVRIRRNDAPPSVTWTLSPATQAALTIDSGVATIPVVLVLSKGNIGHPSEVSRTVEVTLSTSLGSDIGTATRTITNLTGIPTAFTFSVPIGGDIPLPLNSTISLTVANTTPGSPWQGRPIRVFPVDGGTNSRVELTSETVINVDSIQFFDVPYSSGGSPVASFPLGSTAYIRAEVSDPFGTYDINRATITIEDSASTIVTFPNPAAMTQVADDGVSTRTYEYAQVVAAPIGDWTATVTAIEGSEGIVTHTDSAQFRVGRPDIVFNKRSEAVDDHLAQVPPRNYAIPGAIVEYTLRAINQGDGYADADMTIEDEIPADTSLCVTQACAPIGWPDPPFIYTDAPPGTVASGLDTPPTMSVSYFDRSGGSYTPSPDSDGFDPEVGRISISITSTGPNAVFNAANGGTPAGFDIQFRVRVR